MALAVRKQLTESLIFSRLDQCSNLFIDLPQYQIKRLLKLQKACAGFVLNKYATCEDVTKLKWLLVQERIKFAITKSIFKHLFKESVPENLDIQVRTSNQSLRTPNKVTLEYNNPLTSIMQTRYMTNLSTKQNNMNNIEQQLIS